MPDWLLEQIFPYTHQVKVKIETLASSKTILNMNTTTLKLIAVGVAGGLLGFVAARIYFHPSPVPHAPHAQNEKSMEPAEPAEPAEPEKSAESHEPHESHEPVQPLTLVEPTQPPADSSIVSIEQIDTTNPFNNKKFDPILDDKDYVIGFMYKMEALKKALSRPSVSIPKKIGYASFDRQTKDLFL
jgi:hypothetical protein